MGTLRTFGIAAVLSRGLTLSAVAILLGGSVLAQANQAGAMSAAKSSQAYAEVLLRKTDLLAEAESLAADYTETNPKMVDLRKEVAELEAYLAKMLATSAANSQKLTAALGSLMVRRASLNTEFSRIARSMNADHPDYKRAKKRVEVFDAAIKEIFP